MRALLDLILDRAPFADLADALWEANRQGRHDGYVSAITPVNVFYIARKNKGVDTARRAVDEVLFAFRVCPLDQAILQTAQALPFNDYEDAVQAASALASGLDAVITRDPQDFSGATIHVFSLADFLKQLPTQ